jgi:hypothetical protein
MKKEKQIFIINLLYDKIMASKNRRALEKKTIRKLMQLNEDKNVIVNIEWANKYTEYL